MLDVMLAVEGTVVAFALLALVTRLIPFPTTFCRGFYGPPLTLIIPPVLTVIEFYALKCLKASESSFYGLEYP